RQSARAAARESAARAPRRREGAAPRRALRRDHRRRRGGKNVRIAFSAAQRGGQNDRAAGGRGAGPVADRADDEGIHRKMAGRRTLRAVARGETVKAALAWTFMLALVAGCTTAQKAPVEDRSAARPAPARAATPAPQPRPETYIVKRGDTLF